MGAFRGLFSKGLVSKFVHFENLVLLNWLSRKNQAQNISGAEPLVVLEGLLKARQDERQYVGITGNMN